MKTLLLAVELLALAALFGGAVKLWQVRQDLHRELAAAQQMEAALQAMEQPPEQPLPQPGLHKSKAAQAAAQALQAAQMAPAGAAATTPREAPGHTQIEALNGQRERDHHR